MLSAAHWALLQDDAASPAPPAEAAAPQATQPEAAARVDFWMTWERGAAGALPAEGTPERDAFLRALRRDVADWLASAAGDAPALRVKITQVVAREDAGTLAVRFRLSVPADAPGDAPASRRLLDVRGAMAGAAASAQARAEEAVDLLAAMMRRNSLPAPAGPVLRALGRGRISDVAVDDARSRAAAPAPAKSEPELADEVVPPAPAPASATPVTPAPAPAPHEESGSAAAPAPIPAHIDPVERVVGDGGAMSPAPAAAARHHHAAPSAVRLVVAALSAALLGLGVLLCCAALAWRRRRLPAQAAVAQRAWLQGWHAARTQGCKQIPGLDLLGAPGSGDKCHASRQ